MNTSGTVDTDTLAADKCQADLSKAAPSKSPLADTSSKSPKKYNVQRGHQGTSVVPNPPLNASLSGAGNFTTVSAPNPCVVQ